MSSIRDAETFPAHTPAASQIFTTVLCHGPITRLEVARRAGLSPAAVTKAVRPLIEAGYLVEEAEEQARPTLGRPANPVRVDGSRALFVGVKVTGDEIIAVLTDLCCRIRAARHAPLPGRKAEGVLARLYFEHPQRQRDEAVRTGAIGATAMIYAARALGLGSTPMIGFDAEAVASEFALAEDEVPVMLLSVGAALPNNWPQKPRRPVDEVLEFA